MRLSSLGKRTNLRNYENLAESKEKDTGTEASKQQKNFLKIGYLFSVCSVLE